jgi:phage baseplate assembly protein W
MKRAPFSGERKEFLGRGWAMPVALDPATGCVQAAEYEDDIRQAVLLILETAPGERPMREFGCGIHEMTFESMDSGTLQRVRALVEDALRRYEARIDVLEVSVDDEVAADGKLLVEIEYRVRKTNQIGNLVYPFYFREGGRP